jgi:peptidoglycan/xylan/chitin deacetylase (PgdA/CDA1 family)
MFPLAVLLLLACLLLVPLYIIYRPPNSLICFLQRRWPDVLFHVPASRHKLVALTIDDAPSEYTDEILQVLKAHDATATFFVIGSQVPGYEAVLTDAIRSKNELGNHAMHDEPSWLLSDAELRNQINAVKEKLGVVYEHASASSIVAPPNYFRPGSGFFTSRMRNTVKELGYKLVLGSVYPHDPHIPFPSLNAKHILSTVRPGAVIVCHDRRKWTAPMLRTVLPELNSRGYKVVTVSKLLEGFGM